MAAKNSIKEFVENSCYHLYNRGVEKRIIFLDDQDYQVFLSYLKVYLLPKNIELLQQILVDVTSSQKEKDTARKLLRLNNFSDIISLLAYCLMPNHFHLLIRQTEATTIDHFMNSLCTRYSMYFNRKYKRVGPLFQGLYKAVLINTDEQLLHLSRYIHQNPRGLFVQGTPLHSYMYSSYPCYLGIFHADWLKPKEILSYFSNQNRLSYQLFVENFNEESPRSIKSLLIDEEI